MQDYAPPFVLYMKIILQSPTSALDAISLSSFSQGCPTPWPCFVRFKPWCCSTFLSVLPPLPNLHQNRAPFSMVAPLQSWPSWSSLPLFTLFSLLAASHSHLSSYPSIDLIFSSASPTKPLAIFDARKMWLHAGFLFFLWYSVLSSHLCPSCLFRLGTPWTCNCICTGLCTMVFLCNQSLPALASVIKTACVEKEWISFSLKHFKNPEESDRGEKKKKERRGREKENKMEVISTESSIKSKV